MSERCRVVLQAPPDCLDFRKVRAYAMCKAWSIADKERVPFREAIKRSWQDVKKVCAT